MARPARIQQLGSIELARESTRQRLAGIAIGSFFGIFFLSLGGWLFGGHSAEEIIKVIEAVGGIAGGVVGAVVGFYFGNAPKEGDDA